MHKRGTQCAVHAFIWVGGRAQGRSPARAITVTVSRRSRRAARQGARVKRMRALARVRRVSYLAAARGKLAQRERDSFLPHRRG